MSRAHARASAVARPLVLVSVLLVPALALAQDEPSHDDVADFVAALRADLYTCSRGWHGSLTVRIEARGSDGAVVAVSVTDAGGAPDHVAGCVTSTVRSGHLRPFAAPTATIEHRIRL